MSVTAGYRIGKLLDTLQPEFIRIEEQRQKLATQACAAIGMPDASQVPAEAMKKYLEEFDEFLRGDTLDVSVRSINATSLNGNLTPVDLMVLIDCGVVTGLED